MVCPGRVMIVLMQYEAIHSRSNEARVVVPVSIVESSGSARPVHSSIGSRLALCARRPVKHDDRSAHHAFGGLIARRPMYLVTSARGTLGRCFCISPRPAWGSTPSFCGESVEQDRSEQNIQQPSASLFPQCKRRRFLRSNNLNVRRQRCTETTRHSDCG